MDKLYYTVIFKDKVTKKILKKFDYPASKIRSKFFWEKMKLEELQKLTKSRMIDSEDIIMSDITDYQSS